jgi:N-acetylglucosamine-6-sulfatase
VRRLGLALIVVPVALLAGCSIGGSDERSRSRTNEVTGKLTPVPGGKPPQRPNVIVFLTDDQNADELAEMPNVQRLLVDEGVQFDQSFVNFPLCCPSRATALTGQYAHNTGVLANQLPDGGYGRLDSENSLPVWLTEAGYRTAYMGKYMQGVRYKIPPGWQTWQAKGGPTEYDYFDYTLNQNGELVEHGSEPRDHSDAVISRKATEYVDRYGPEPRPFFLMLGYSAPHVRGGPDRGCGPQPAPRDERAFDHAPFPPSPGFEESDTSDKPEEIRRGQLDPEVEEKIVARYRCRLESLLGVDRGVGQTVRALEETDSLRDTYLIFTSDNGLMQGEHKIKGGKEQPYEEAIRVPLVIRGPGIPHGKASQSTVVNADLAPTIAAIAGARPTITVDGESLLPLAGHPSRTRPLDLPVQGAGFEAVRTPRYTYVERDTGEAELYDLERDPYQLDNLAGEPRLADVEARLATRLSELQECAGRSCRERTGGS